MGDLKASEMRFLRSNKDWIRNNDIWEEFEILSITEQMSFNKDKWRDHVMRMKAERLSKQVMAYKPSAKRNLGRQDGEGGTGSLS